MLLNTEYVFWFLLQILSQSFLILGRSERDMIEKYIVRHVKYRYSCQILTKLQFPQRMFEKKNIQITRLVKIRPVGAELFHVNRQTDRHEAKSRLSQLCESA